MATRQDLTVAIATVESNLTDTINEILSQVSRVQTIIADLRDKAANGPDLQPEVDQLNAISSELINTKAVVVAVEPPVV